MKINLEKELIRQNAKINTPAELLLVKEYEKLGEQSNDLSRLGFTHLEEGRKIREKASEARLQTKGFDQSRVFHISQIKAIAEKYYLRFLPSYLYKGSVDPELPLKVGTFEAAYGVKMGSSPQVSTYVIERRTKYGLDTLEDNSFILAPKESFRLQERPKDPLLFYAINGEYFYLVHKWGNDLSIIRMLMAVYSNWWVTWITLALVVACGLLLAGAKTVVIPTMLFTCFVVFFGSLVKQKPFSLYTKNEWNSKWID